MIIHSYNDHVRLLLPNVRSSMQQSLIAPRQSRHCYEIKWIRPHSLPLADSSGLISPDETDLFRAVAQAVTDGLPVTQESHSRMPFMPAYTPRRAEKRRRQLILLPRHHPLVGGEELGESRLTEPRGTHLTESTEDSCEVLLGLESTCNGYIEDACVFFYQQLLGSLHPCPQNKSVRSNSRRLMEHLREVCRAQLCFLGHLHQAHVFMEVFMNKAGHPAELHWGETSTVVTHRAPQSSLRMHQRACQSAPD